MLRLARRHAPAERGEVLAQLPDQGRDADSSEAVARRELHSVLHGAVAGLPERQGRVLNGLWRFATTLAAATPQ